MIEHFAPTYNPQMVSKPKCIASAGVQNRHEIQIGVDILIKAIGFALDWQLPKDSFYIPGIHFDVRLLIRSLWQCVCVGCYFSLLEIIFAFAFKAYARFVCDLCRFVICDFAMANDLFPWLACISYFADVYLFLSLLLLAILSFRECYLWCTLVSALI